MDKLKPILGPDISIDGMCELRVRRFEDYVNVVILDPEDLGCELCTVTISRKGRSVDRVWVNGYPMEREG